MSQNGQQQILVIDDEENILRFLTRALEKRGYIVRTALTAGEGFKKICEIKPDLVVTDIVMPDMNGIDLLKRVKGLDPDINVIMITAHASLDTAISAIHGGASDYLLKPFKVEEFCVVVKRALSCKRIVSDDPAKEKELETRYNYKNLIGQSPQIQEVYKLIERVAGTETTVLITGESGTGKELVARSIHYGSKRKDKPFVSINCAALPELLLESELFGYEKGSFTGAIATKMGLLELAQDGTFFFDEVGEIPPHIQAKLLRVLQEKEIRHVGGLQDIKVNIRIVAATSKDLKVEVQNACFREDLFYRLNVVQIHLPPLRERRDDIPRFLDHFLKFYCEKLSSPRKIEIERKALSYLQDEYGWPGNIRELENLIERMIMLSDNGTVTHDQIIAMHDKEPRISNGGSGNGNGERDLKTETDEFEKKLISEVLRETHGNKFQAAKRLKVSRQSLQYKIKKYELE